MVDRSSRTDERSDGDYIEIGAAVGGKITSSPGDPSDLPHLEINPPEEPCHGAGSSGILSKMVFRVVSEFRRINTRMWDLVGRRSVPNTAGDVHRSVGVDGPEHRASDRDALDLRREQTEPREELPIGRSLSAYGELHDFAPRSDSLSPSSASLVLASSSANSSSRSVLSRGTTYSALVRTNRAPRARSIEATTFVLEQATQHLQRQQLQRGGLQEGEVVPTSDFTGPLTDSGRCSTETNGSAFDATQPPSRASASSGRADQISFLRRNTNGAIYKQ
uniref:Uncharacterized protein n=1 Tax=Anopheles atroparvus TaxID=41427 RepID=A0A182J7X9_ANOAO